MADQPKAIVVRCPSCGGRLKAPKDLIGRQAKCPKCGQTITIAPSGASPKQTNSQPTKSTAPEKKAPTQPTTQPLEEPPPLGTSGPTAPGQPGEGEALSGVRWNFLVSLGWLFVGWGLTGLAPWAALGPGWLEALLNVLPFLVTAGLIGWNLWASLRILGHTGRALAALPLTGLQVLLFTLLLYQIACHRGAEHFVWDRVPGFFDWIALVLVHAVRAADLMDGIEAYGLNFQAVHNASHLTAWTLILYHLVIDLFLLRLLMEGVDQWKRSLLEGGRTRQWVLWGSITVLVGFVAIWLFSALYWRPWQPWDLVLWPVDNLLRVVDFCDALVIYHVQVHQVPTLPWEGTLTLLCRVLMALLLAGLLARVVQEFSIRWLNGRGLKRAELEQIAERNADKPTGEVARNRAAELKWREEHPTSIHWPSGLEVLSTLGPACVLALFLFIAGYDDPCEPLAAAAVGPDERAAGRALGALQRMGSRAESAVDPLQGALQDLETARQEAVLETLGHLGPSATEVLSELLRDEDRQKRLIVVRALERLGKSGVPVLISALPSDDNDLRQSVQQAIHDVGHDALQPVLDHFDPENLFDLLPVLESLDPYWDLRGSDNPHFPPAAGSRELLVHLQRAEHVSEVREAVRDLADLAAVGSSLFVSALRRRLCDLNAEDAFEEVCGLAAPILVEQVANGDAHLRDGAAHVLKQISRPVRPLAHGSGHTLMLNDADTGKTLWQGSTRSRYEIVPFGMRPFRSIALSPDGRWIVSGGDDKAVTLWTTSSGKKVRTLAGHNGPVYSVAFSPDGKRIASASGDGSVKIWYARNGREARTLTGHKDTVYGIAYSPDGKRVASGSGDATVKIWYARNGREAHTLTGHTSGVTSVAFSPDATRIASASGDSTVKIWDASAGKELLTLAAEATESRGLHSVAFASDGRRIAAGTVGAYLEWDTTTGELLSSHALGYQFRSAPVHTVGFGSDGIAWGSSMSVASPNGEWFTCDAAGESIVFCVEPTGAR